MPAAWSCVCGHCHQATYKAAGREQRHSPGRPHPSLPPTHTGICALLAVSLLLTPCYSSSFC